jgi:hypothetical protein
MDIWHGFLSMYPRGWAANKAGETRKIKQDILSRLEELDRTQEYQQVAGDLWKMRYQLEAYLEQIYHKEETYWQQRGGEKWLLEGDANTAYFHSCANIMGEGEKLGSVH